MKNINIKKFFHKLNPALILILILFSGLFSSIWAQRPRNIPPADDYKPFQVDPVLGIIIYVILPVIFVVLYILWRRRERKRREERNKNMD